MRSVWLPSRRRKCGMPAALPSACGAKLHPGRPAEIWFQGELSIPHSNALRALEPLAHSARAGKPRHASPHLGGATGGSPGRSLPEWPAEGYLSGAVRASRRLPGARHRRRPGHAGSRHRGCEQAPARNQPMRQRQGHRPADPRRRRLARFATTRRAGDYRAHAASALRARAELGRPFARLRTYGTIRAAPFSAAASGPPMRPSSTRVSRRPECPDRQIRDHRLKWNQRLGPGQNLGRLALWVQCLRASGAAPD